MSTEDGKKIEKRKINAIDAWHIRERGLLLPVAAAMCIYETNRLQQIAERQKALMDEMDVLDKELISLYDDEMLLDSLPTSKSLPATDWD